MIIMTFDYNNQGLSHIDMFESAIYFIYIHVCVSNFVAINIYANKKCAKLNDIGFLETYALSP